MTPGPPPSSAATVAMSAPKVPSWIKADKIAAQTWRRVAADLSATGTLAASDGDVLALYCDTMSRWRAAVDAVRKNGLSYESAKARTGEKMFRSRPEARGAINLAGELLRLAGELGLSPLARKRLGVGVDAHREPAASLIKLHESP